MTSRVVFPIYSRPRTNREYRMLYKAIIEQPAKMVDLYVVLSRGATYLARQAHSKEHRRPLRKIPDVFRRAFEDPE